MLKLNADKSVKKENNIHKWEGNQLATGKMCLGLSSMFAPFFVPTLVTLRLIHFDTLPDYMDEGEAADVVCLEFSRSFDTVSHNILLQKLW